MTGPFRKEHASIAIGNPCCQHKQGSSVDLCGFLFRTSTPKKFRFPDHRLNGHSSSPPTKQWAGDQVMASTEYEESRVIEGDGERVNQSAGADTHLRAHETKAKIVCRLRLEKKKKTRKKREE